MDSTAAEYGVCKGTVCLAIQWVENTLVKDGTFSLPGKKVLKRKSGTIQYIAADVTESPIHPPERRPKRVLFGEKKRHSLKTQVIMKRNTMEIADVQEAEGGGHDFRMFKDSIGKSVSNSIPLDADPGYLGIAAYHPAGLIPVKSSKKHQLTKKEKAYNKKLARRRVVIEHINAKIKTFKSMADPYRGHHRNRHSLRMALICGLINYDRNI